MLGLSARLALSAFALQEPDRHLYPDSREYLALARGLLDGRGLTQSPAGTPSPVPETKFTPGFALLLASLGTLSASAQVPLLLLLQAGLALLPAFALARGLRQQGHTGRAPAVAVAVLLMDPVSLALSSQVLGETTFLALAGVRLVLLVRCLAATGGEREAFACGLTSGLLAMVKPIGTFLWLADAAALALAPAPRKARRVAMALFGFTLVVMPWVARNAGLGVTGLSSGGGPQLRNWNAAIVESRARGLPFWEVRKEYATRFAGSTRYVSDAMGVFATYPAATARVTATSVVALLADPGHHLLMKPLGLSGTGLRQGAPRSGALAALAVLAFCASWWVALMVLAARGARHLWRHACSTLTACAVTGAYFVLLSLHITLAEGVRFRAPLIPVLALLAAVGAETWRRAPSPEAPTN